MKFSHIQFPEETFGPNFEPKYNLPLWIEADSIISCLPPDNNVAPGVGWFSLPVSTWIQPAASIHDPWYTAAKRGAISRTFQKKLEGDTWFWRIAEATNRELCTYDGYRINDLDRYTRHIDQLIACWQIIRSPIGVVCYFTMI